MTIGYSVLLIEQNKKADGRLLGVKLGRECMKHNISVTAVAKKFKVSRQTVYNWFVGLVAPNKARETAIKDYIASL